jgi:hypothetical protein
MGRLGRIAADDPANFKRTPSSWLRAGGGKNMRPSSLVNIQRQEGLEQCNPEVKRIITSPPPIVQEGG